MGAEFHGRADLLDQDLDEFLSFDLVEWPLEGNREFVAPPVGLQHPQDECARSTGPRPLEEDGFRFHAQENRSRT